MYPLAPLLTAPLLCLACLACDHHRNLEQGITRHMYVCHVHVCLICQLLPSPLSSLT